MNKNSLLVLVTLVFMGFVIVYSFISDNRREELLKNTKKTKAVFHRYIEETTDDGSAGIFEYRINGKEYEFRQRGDFWNLEIGDSVEIKYSIIDNSVAEVIGK